MAGRGDRKRSSTDQRESAAASLGWIRPGKTASIELLIRDQIGPPSTTRSTSSALTSTARPADSAVAARGQSYPAQALSLVE
jgi:hypothetical protein